MREFLELMRDPWHALFFGYVVTIAIETPILYFGLSAQHSRSRRLFAGVWLTACTYPLVILVIPELLDPSSQRISYLLVAESIAHFGECLLFYLAFGPLKQFWRDMVVVFTANLASFGLAEAVWWMALPGD